MARPINIRDEAERVLARMQGRRTYRTRIPCKRGHTVERYVKNGDCATCRRTIYNPNVMIMNRDDREAMKAERMANGEFYVKL